VESLREHGQYSPVITTLSGTILAGHHLVQAALRLGWTEVAIWPVDVSDAIARRILIADNRTSDLATYDSTALVELLRSVPDLIGTGFDADELAALESALDGAPVGGGVPKVDVDKEQLRIGTYRFEVESDTFGAWESALIDQSGTPKAARRVVRARLLLPEPVRTPTVRHDPASTPSPPASVIVESVPIDDLVPVAGNPRHGDVGSIAESLREFGQYRPLVVTNDNVVLKGNHTLKAMKASGCTHALVTRVDADDDRARKIVAMDNRSSDLAGYDDDKLRDLLRSVDSWAGTGYDGDDVDDLLAGGPSRPTRTTRTTSVSIGQVTFGVQRQQFAAWAIDLPEGTELVEIADRLDIPVDACTF
jgi:ParB-like chromosome segregation protein Spo0J